MPAFLFIYYLDKLELGVGSEDQLELSWGAGRVVLGWEGGRTMGAESSR